MKITQVVRNNRKKSFEVRTPKGTYSFPYAKLDVRPSSTNRVTDVFADPEAALEAFTYRLESGEEDTVPLDQVLYYNQDPDLLREVLVHRLTVEAANAVKASGLRKRELIRRLGTSASQFYRLLDTTNHAKSVGQLLVLLHLVDHEVTVVERQDRPPVSMVR